MQELLSIMPFMLEGYDAMNRKQKVFDVDREGFVKTLFGVINTHEKNVIGVAFDGIEPVGYGVGFDDTPTYGTTKSFLLWALYAKPEYSKTVGPMIFNGAEEWAKEHGYKKLNAYNARFSGASFRLFEKIFGMRRSQIKFTKTI